MYNNLTGTNSGFSDNSFDYNQVLRVLSYAITFSHQNWKDELGKTVTMSLEAIYTELQDLEKRRINLEEILVSLNTILNNLESDNSGNGQSKHKILRYTTQSDDTPYHSGGSSRHR